MGARNGDVLRDLGQELTVVTSVQTGSATQPAFSGARFS
jgi:hypothetical protein